MDFNIKEEKEKLRKKYNKISLIKSLGFAITYFVYVTSSIYVIPFLKIMLILFKLDIYLIDMIVMLMEYFFISLPLFSVVVSDMEMRKILREIRDLSEKEKLHSLREQRVRNEKILEEEFESKKEDIKIAVDMFSKLSRSEQIAILNEMKEHRNLDQVANVAMSEYLQDKFEDIIDYTGDKKNDGYTRKRVKKD